MIRHENTSPTGLSDAFSYLNTFGYTSCMLTYHSKQSDYFVKLARAINPNLNLKYIIAMRTYAVSPEYLAMMIKGFNEIAENKLIFNIVAGDLHKDETSVQDLIDSSMLTSSQDRVRYTTKFLEKFKSLDQIKDIFPELIISGTSEITLDNCLRFGDYSLCMVDYYLENKNKFLPFKNKMVSLQILIRDTDEEAQKIKNDNFSGDQLKWTYFYSEKTLTEKIEELKREGVTDLMITSFHLDDQVHRVHNFVKRMSNLNGYN